MLAAIAAVLGLLAPQAHAGPVPAVELGLRTTAGADEALAGGGARLYRAQPEVLVGAHPAAHLDLIAGGGLGPAYVVRPPGGAVDLTVSGTLGLRFPVEGANVLVTARAEALTRGGAAVTLHLGLSLDRVR